MFDNHKYIAFKTIVTREVRRFSRIWVQTLVPPAITICLYFVIFGNLVGRRIGEMGGFQYMEFIIPGLIMMSVIQNSYSNVVSSFYSAKFQKTVEELLVAPIPNYIILSGLIAGGMCRGLAVGVIVTVMSLLFSDLNIQYPAITVSIILLTSILFSLAGFINAIFANSFDDIAIIPTFVLTPLIYLGGVFYSVQLLPTFWQIVSALNPIFYMVNAFRFGILGASDIDVRWAFLILFIFIAVLYTCCIWLLRSGKGIRT